MANHDQLEVRFLNAEAAAFDAEELRFEAPPAPKIAHSSRAVLVRAFDILMAEFWEVDAVIVAMPTEQRRARVEAKGGATTGKSCWMTITDTGKRFGY